MKKTFLTVLLILTLMFVLCSCDIASLIGGKGEEEPDEPVTLDLAIDGLTLYLDSNKLNVKQKFDRFIATLEKETDISVTEAESADEADIVYSVTSNEKANALIGYYSLELSGKTLNLSASDLDSMTYAESIVLAMCKDSTLTVDESELSSGYLNLYDYKKTKRPTLYTEEELAALTLLAEIRLDGAKVAGLDPEQTDLELGIAYNKDLPEVTAKAASTAATVDVIQPTKENGGKCTVSVTSGTNKTEYGITFYLEDGKVGTEIVNKDGKDGVITFVIDDGVISTAEFMLNTFFPKYEHLTASFAIKTKSLATLVKTTDDDGNLVWQKDENGKYVYEANEETVAFWKQILATGQAELLSHSHTHTYWGDDDGGGVFEYERNDGSKATSENFPKGNVTMELAASAQILYDLFGEESYGFVKPGVGAKLSDYYYALLEVGGVYTSARGTRGSGNFPAIVNYAINFRQISKRFDVMAYMIEHYDTNPLKRTDKFSSYDDCIEAGIPNWRDYIDAALLGGGWACFCIHDIKPEGYTDLGSTAHFIYESQADKLFGYANGLADRAWIATYDEAMQYYISWSTAKIEAKISGGERINVTYESGELDKRNVCPLTVKVELPLSWASAKTASGEALTVYGEGSERYVLVEAIPDESVSVFAMD